MLDTVQNNILIHIPSYSNEYISSAVLPEIGYEFWAPLVEYFLAKSDTIEIHCWNVELDTIEEIKSLFKGNIETRKEGELTIFKANNTPSISEYLLNNNLYKRSELKWFTLNLNKDKTPVFHSGHWGTELYVPNFTEKNITFIKSVTPDGTYFNQYYH